MKKLKRIIKKNWGLKYKVFNKDQTLMDLALEIACKSEDCSPEEAYSMYIGNPTLHLPGIIAMMIIDDLGLDAANINAGLTIGEIVGLTNL